MKNYINLDKTKLTNIIAEAMTNLHTGYREETEPWNEVDGVESVQNEIENNPLNSPTNNYYDKEVNEMKNNKIKLTENTLRNIIRESVRNIINEYADEPDTDNNAMNYALLKLQNLGEEINNIGLYGLAEDINELLMKYKKY